ncbi:MAG: UDP-N-acetylmuramoyl-L-alanine--D-glutamate ligase [Anaerolineaceae bacterium 4572_78]|nr:MAG: UDP-N-acetylmuramoyl-L-alanine--D-glutamate ligase [Anaerolineaceae bacterium 4572_78]
MSLNFSQTDFSNLNIIVVGLAREGIAITRFLAEQGATVIVTDMESADKLQNSIEQLHDLDITYMLGGHPDSLFDIETPQSFAGYCPPKRPDLIVVSPGVPINIPFLQQAIAYNIPLSTETRIFCHECPTPIIGISGSSGKTTTTTLVGKMMHASGFITYVGGNIGRPLIARLNQIKSDHKVVMELSSFQLEYFHPSATIFSPSPSLSHGWSPHIGALLNITPNHLDRHKTMVAYTHAKSSLVHYLKPNHVAVLGWDDPITRNFAYDLVASIMWFSRNEQVKNGTCIVDNKISLVRHGMVIPINPVSAIKLRGKHNIDNILAACAIAAAGGASIEAMAEIATTFTGVAHRLELVAIKDGIAFYNDSVATSPERLIAGVKAFKEPLVLLAGGKDKDLPWQEAARLITKQVKHLILFGYDQDLIYEAVQKELMITGQSLSVYRCHTLENAVSKSKEISVAGDVVLLSPGGTSFDAYLDFAERGEHFRQLV